MITNAVNFDLESLAETEKCIPSESYPSIIKN